MSQVEFSDSVKATFYAIYDNNQENLKKVPQALLDMGLGYMDILMLTKTELNLDLGRAILLLEIPDCTGVNDDEFKTI